MNPRYMSLLLVFVSSFAHAASVTFSATIEGAPREVSLEQFSAEGRGYVSLSGIASQLGGAARITPLQVELDHAGNSAIVPVNDTQVTASRGSFTLEHPVLPFEGDILISEADVPLFFRSAFGLDVAQRTPVGTLQGSDPVELEEAAAMDEPAEELLGDPIAAGTPPPSTPATLKLSPIQKIIIDPGHGGEDMGVVGAGGAAEKDIALAVAQVLAAQLQEQGLEVYLTRDADKPLTNRERVNIAKQQQGDLFVSLHVAASPVPRSNGFEIFSPVRRAEAQKRGGISFATPAITDYSAMNQFISESIAENIAASAGAVPRGVRQAPLRVLSELQMPALMIELGFMTNSSEEQLLTSQPYQAKLAGGIAAGVNQAIEAYEKNL